MARARRLRHRWTFQQRGADGNGDRRGAWAAGFTRWVEVTYLRGGEAVMQERLTGLQPVILTVRSDVLTRTISNGFRAFDESAAGRVANVTAAAASKTPGYIDIMATIGGPQG